MASVFLYHVVGDLTVGKPEMLEFSETETVESAIRAIGESTECGIPVWKRRSHVGMMENNETRQQRFVGILTSLDIVSFFAKSQCLEDQDKAMKTQVSDVVVPNNALLKVVDPGTRLIDALEMMKHGVRRLLVPKSKVWKGTSKRFSIIYNGKWLKYIENGSSNDLIVNANIRSLSASTSPYMRDKFVCLSREDMIRFLIGCLGALAPLPLSSISSLGAINLNYNSIQASLPALQVSPKHLGDDPNAVAVVEMTPDGQHKILGEISASKLWKCDYLAAGWALANLSAGQFVMGVEDNVSSLLFPDTSVDSTVEQNNVVSGVGSEKAMKLSEFSVGRSMYRGRSATLTCRSRSSLAAVMAQMLCHRATHVWVTEDENEDVLVGVVGYADILVAVTKQPVALIPTTRSITHLASETQS
ncbi:hypothetical protein V6N13_042694 [Hibiscus sabdariffa]|uniref:CBS domain-containing protein n=1 Tax=Hibiscus sabdariffa TaxID=183260 RepID=A0ABR2G4B5_9ROSI